MRKKFWIPLLAIGCCAAVVLLLLHQGVLLLNNPSSAEFPVRGVDVSSYQGEIDWMVLSSQNISFAYIKATEGSSYTDSCFARNFDAAQKTPLRVGAYHFFSYDSPGASQAAHFIQTVPMGDGMLPPVVDVEFYGDYQKNPLPRQTVAPELKDMLRLLEEHYHQKPVLYATKTSYSLYLSGEYEDYDIWMRDVITKPALPNGRRWVFWQYTNREKLRGYQGSETFIDMNVFAGTKEEFEGYGHPYVSPVS